uniref:Uncharacterized protein n=1 Tax=Maylandia zebra TaxID=106582 RepID=A0A3P9C9D9_9CICH
MSEKNFRPWTEKVFFSWFLCALIYPILKELQAERVTGEDGTEEKMLGFWSLLVLSVLVGCICCVFSWMLTYLDSFQPGMDFPTLCSNVLMCLVVLRCPVLSMFSITVFDGSALQLYSAIALCYSLFLLVVFTCEHNLTLI